MKLILRQLKPEVPVQNTGRNRDKINNLVGDIKKQTRKQESAPSYLDIGAD